jgi:hypothetical protein
VPKVSVKAASDGPGIGGFDELGAPGRGRTNSRDMTV